MALVVCDGGESIALRYLVNKLATPENLVLCLFKSNTTPAEADVIGTYTEADFTGYSNITLTGASWTVSGTAPTSIGYAQQTFTSSAGSQSEAFEYRGSGKFGLSGRAETDFVPTITWQFDGSGGVRVGGSGLTEQFDPYAQARLEDEELLEIA